MEVTAITFLGLVAGVLTTVAFVPQAVKSWRSRSTRDVSLAMMVILIVGMTLWLVYGILRSDLPLIAANGTTLLLAGSILVCKVRFK